MKLFTKDIDKKLFKQYPLGSDLSQQKVIAKIFNPYGNYRWYIINSDPDDPDYLWAIVQNGSIVEIGSVSRNELESIRVSPFRLPLERDLSFREINAEEAWRNIRSGNYMKRGGSVDEDDNKGMILNQVEGMEHHVEELEEAAKKAKEVPAWVVAKSQRASTDLSDITHYLDGENEQREEEDEGEEMARGGVVKMIPEGEEYRYQGRQNLEKDILAKIEGQINNMTFAGNFEIRDKEGKYYKYTEGYLYNLDDYDQQWLAKSNIKLKPEEKIFRYFTRTTAIGGMMPVIKINTQKGLAYFPIYDEEKDMIKGFDAKSTPLQYLNLTSDSLKMEKGGITGDLHSLTDKLLSQKIEMFLEKVKPIKYYYIDDTTNMLVVGFDENYTQDAAYKFHKAATSSVEFFDADSVDMEYDSKTNDTKYFIKLKRDAKFAKGGMTEHGLRAGDKILSGKVVGTTIRVRNENFDEDAKIDLETGERTVLIYDKKTKKYIEKKEGGGYFEKEGDLLKEGDFVYKADGQKARVEEVTDDEYYLYSFMQSSPKPFSKKKVDDYIKTGFWSMKPKSNQMAKGGEMAASGMFVGKRKYKTYRPEEWNYDNILKVLDDNFGWDESMGKFINRDDLYDVIYKYGEGSNSESYIKVKAILEKNGWEVILPKDKMAKGGEITVKVGDKVKSKKGIEGEVYESTGTMFKLKDKYGGKSTKWHSTKDFKKSEILSMAMGGESSNVWVIYTKDWGKKPQIVDEFTATHTTAKRKLKNYQEAKPNSDIVYMMTDKVNFYDMYEDNMAKGGTTKSKYTVIVHHGGEMDDEVFHTDSLKQAKEYAFMGEQSEIYDNELNKEVEVTPMAMGGATFEDKVQSIKRSLLERKKVSPAVQKDYGKTYSPKEAEESARRIAGAQRAKYELKSITGRGRKKKTKA